MSLYELFIGLRYLKSKKNQGFISFNTILSIVTVFISVFILIIVLSVMNGFQAKIKEKILDVDSHIVVSSFYGGSEGRSIKNYRALAKRVKKVKGVKSVLPFIQGQGLFRYKKYISYVLIRGMGTRGHVPVEASKFITKGKEFFCKKKGVFIGYRMARKYKVKQGQYIELIIPKGRMTAATGINPGLGKFRVLGFFNTGFMEFDRKLVLMSLRDSQRLYSVGDVAWGLSVKINDIFKMNHYAEKVSSVIGIDFVTITAEQKNQNLFKAFELEKFIMTVILSLVIISAGFTIMGTLVMVVMEKRKAIGVLKSMGAKLKSIMIIFILEGFFIGIMGTLLGVLLGLAASLNLEAILKWIETFINKIMIYVYGLLNSGLPEKITIVPKNIYYIDFIPTLIKPETVVFISVCTVLLSTLSAIFPAWQASRQRPVETIRYE